MRPTRSTGWFGLILISILIHANKTRFLFSRSYKCSVRVDDGEWQVIDKSCSNTECFISQSSIAGFKGSFEACVVACGFGSEETETSEFYWLKKLNKARVQKSILKYETPVLEETPAAKLVVDVTKRTVTGIHDI
jgi:hypothetical protein